MGSARPRFLGHEQPPAVFAPREVIEMVLWSTGALRNTSGKVRPHLKSVFKSRALEYRSANRDLCLQRFPGGGDLRDYNGYLQHSWWQQF
jgi:hypothetical protein